MANQAQVAEYAGTLAKELCALCRGEGLDELAHIFAVAALKPQEGTRTPQERRSSTDRSHAHAGVRRRARCRRGQGRAPTRALCALLPIHGCSAMSNTVPSGRGT